MTQWQVNPRILATPKVNKVVRYLTVLEDAEEWKQRLAENGGACSRCSRPCQRDELCIKALSEIFKIHPGMASRELRQVAEYLNDEISDFFFNDEEENKAIIIRRSRTEDPGIPRVFARSAFGIDEIALILASVEEKRLLKKHRVATRG
ncbi:hypothetical protein [Thermococcus aciditolerans]|uniref:Uncharacterized protein n=1 Tax=Thermococcus aciditolerans TaxID=2598455 RepID=A0A5C0SM18_9EURY|nr:hypothetical protein [Thermococcus aciditolerans]QEK15453.1 hypothetical protein FPV09_10550 [Thermococcus aciditolerans]